MLLKDISWKPITHVAKIYLRVMPIKNLRHTNFSAFSYCVAGAYTRSCVQGLLRKENTLSLKRQDFRGKKVTEYKNACFDFLYKFYFKYFPF